MRWWSIVRCRCVMGLAVWVFVEEFRDDEHSLAQLSLDMRRAPYDLTILRRRIIGDSKQTM